VAASAADSKKKYRRRISEARRRKKPSGVIGFRLLGAAAWRLVVTAHFSWIDLM
jgi:hypothetical protein